MSSSDALKKLDAKIMKGLERAGFDDVMMVGTVEVRGYFDVRFIEDGGGEDALIGEYPTFDCRAEDLPPIDQEEEVEVEGQGTFRYLSRRSAGIGRALVILGNVL